MTEHWIEIEGPAGAVEHPLERELTRIGGAGADVVLEGAPRGELHLWNDPPKAVWLGGAGGPVLAGSTFDEYLLADGDRITWSDWRITFHEAGAIAEFEELAAEPVRRMRVVPLPEAWLRVKAGVLVEQGLADKQVAKRWSDAVIRGDFQAEACARELLAENEVPDDHPRVLERSSRLLRDLVMAPLQRGAAGASRKARVATKNTAAAAVAQFIIVGIILGMTFVAMVLARLKWGTSFDGWIDTILGN